MRCALEWESTLWFPRKPVRFELREAKLRRENTRCLPSTDLGRPAGVLGGLPVARRPGVLAKPSARARCSLQVLRIDDATTLASPKRVLRPSRDGAGAGGGGPRTVFLEGCSVWRGYDVVNSGTGQARGRVEPGFGAERPHLGEVKQQPTSRRFLSSPFAPTEPLPKPNSHNTLRHNHSKHPQ